MNTNISFKKYLSVCIIGFGLGGLIWGWIFGRAAHFGNPGLAVSYKFSGALFILLGGISLFLFTKYRKFIFRIIWIGFIGGFFAFFIGEYFGEFVMGFIIFDLIGSIIPYIYIAGPYLLYGEIIHLLIVGMAIGALYISMINERFILMLPRGKWLVSLNVLLIIIMSFLVLISNNYLLMLSFLMFLLLLNYIVRTYKKFRGFILLSIFSLPVVYMASILIVSFFSDILGISYEYLLWQYIIRFSFTGIVFGLFLGLGMYKHCKEENVQPSIPNINNI